MHLSDRLLSLPFLQIPTTDDGRRPHGRGVRASTKLPEDAQRVGLSQFVAERDLVVVVFVDLGKLEEVKRKGRMNVVFMFP